ncbi:hypothetical protein DFJ63DRAFT_311278 [Scheffersomyces coipomensis]|uniref:uncharacterized protein n=1 Tax=Scheffersomyces coipomensis TaxID=1788519 RepID=UPI00315CE020
MNGNDIIERDDEIRLALVGRDKKKDDFWSKSVPWIQFVSAIGIPLLIAVWFYFQVFQGPLDYNGYLFSIFLATQPFVYTEISPGRVIILPRSLEFDGIFYSESRYLYRTSAVYHTILLIVSSRLLIKARRRNVEAFNDGWSLGAYEGLCYFLMAIYSILNICVAIVDFPFENTLFLTFYLSTMWMCIMMLLEATVCKT